MNSRQQVENALYRKLRTVRFAYAKVTSLQSLAKPWNGTGPESPVPVDGDALALLRGAKS